MKGGKILGPGSLWGVENAILTNPKLRTDATGLALSYLQIQYLSSDQIEELSARYPEEGKAIRKSILWTGLRRALFTGMVPPTWVSDGLGHDPDAKPLRRQ